MLSAILPVTSSAPLIALYLIELEAAIAATLGEVRQAAELYVRAIDHRRAYDVEQGLTTPVGGIAVVLLATGRHG